jgi:hypothetical protein
MLEHIATRLLDIAYDEQGAHFGLVRPSSADTTGAAGQHS